MRRAARLLALVTLTMGIVGLGATSHAQSLEVESEWAVEHCPGVALSGTDVEGGCLLHTEGKLEFRKHVFGVESHITKCDLEANERLNEDGSGYYLEQVLFGTNCTRRPVRDELGESIPWSVSHAETNDMLVRTVNFMLEPVGGGTDETCEIDLRMTNVSGHTWEVGSQTIESPSHGLSGFRCEILGHHLTEENGSHEGETEEEVYYLHLGP